MNQAIRSLDDLVDRDRTIDCNARGDELLVKVLAVAELPTRFGAFRTVAFVNNRDGKEHLAIVRGSVIGAADVMTRMHSECLTGDALGSLRCDCRDQLENALRTLSTLDRGLLLYLRQEGRGIGLNNKIRAYALQDRGLDTVDANLALGFHDDERDYSIAAAMIRSLTIQSVRLMTNNPRKMDQLRALGVLVTSRVPHVMAANEYNRFYLETKANRSGHWMDVNERPAPRLSVVPSPPKTSVGGNGCGA